MSFARFHLVPCFARSGRSLRLATAGRLLAIVFLAQALQLSPVWAQGAAAERLFLEAQRLEAVGDPAAALRELEMLAERFPADRRTPQALLMASELYRKQGDMERASAALSRLREQHAATPEAAEAMVREAEQQAAMARSRGDWEDALAAMRRVVLVYGQDSHPRLEARARALLRAAELRRSLGDADGAARDLLAVIEDEPEGAWTPAARLAFGEILLKRDAPAALEVLESLASMASGGDDPGSLARRRISLYQRRVLRAEIGTAVWAARRFPATELGLREPSAVAAAEDGRVAVVDRRADTVILISAAGAELGRLSFASERPGFLPDGRLFVAAEGGVVLPFDGESYALRDPRPGKDGALRDLLAAAPGPFGGWRVLARGSRGLFEIDAAGTGRERLAEERPQLIDVTFDAAGHTLALDARAGRVLRFDLDGVPRALVQGTWKRAEALAVDAMGYVFVLDRGNRRVEVFAPDGRPLDPLGPDLGGGIELRQPVDLAVDGSGRLIIADAKLPFLVRVE